MVSNEIRNNVAALGGLLHAVGEEQAAMIRLVRTNLMAVAETAEELERGLYAPIPEAGVGSENYEIQDCSGDCDACHNTAGEVR